MSHRPSRTIRSPEQWQQAVSRPTIYRTLDRVPARSDDNYREQNAAI